MKHLQISQFDRLTSRAWTGQTDNAPSPFPGRWPTRIAWRCRWARQTEFYLGKPTRQAAARFSWLCTHQAGMFATYFLEFDRKHLPIYHWSLYTGLAVHQGLYSVYHFWQGHLDMGQHFALPLHRKRLGGMVVYSPYRALAVERKEAWASYMRLHTPLKPRLAVSEVLE